MCAQALETEEARAARSKRVAEALSSYKRKAGLLVDPAAEAAAQEAFRQGQELMHKVRGAIAAAKHVYAVILKLSHCHLSLSVHLSRLPTASLRQHNMQLDCCFQQGQQWCPRLMQGKLQAAMIPFEEAIRLVSFRSRVGGEATLQKAICLDSLVGTSLFLIHCGLFSDCSISWMLCVADGHAKQEWDGRML